MAGDASSMSSELCWLAWFVLELQCMAVPVIALVLLFLRVKQEKRRKAIAWLKLQSRNPQPAKPPLTASLVTNPFVTVSPSTNTGNTSVLPSLLSGHQSGQELLSGQEHGAFPTCIETTTAPGTKYPTVQATVMTTATTGMAHTTGKGATTLSESFLNKLP